MKIGNPFREQWRALGDFALTTLDNLISSLQGAWKVEHTDDDRHGHVHATSLQVGRISYSSILTPTFTAAQINNYSDGNLRDAGLIRATVSGVTEVSLTGIAVPLDELGSILDGRVLVIENAHATAVIILEHEDTNSSPANRFVVPLNPDVVTGATSRYFCLPKTLTTLVYNATAARWIVASRTNEELLSYGEFGSSGNDYAPPAFRSARVVRLVPTAANLTISGFNATNVSAPSRKTIINEGVYRFAILHMNTGSAAANRVQCPGGTMYYVNPRESVDLYRETDGTWHIILKADQWVDVTYDAGNFTASGGGTWGVDSGDQATYCYQIDGNKMTVSLEINMSDVSGAPTELRAAVPAGRTIARTTRSFCQVFNGGVWQTAIIVATTGNTFLQIMRLDFTAWTNTAADDTYVFGQLSFMVETSCATVSEPHQDVAHSDVAHGDAGHTDVAHSDTTHVDTHGDIAHSDTAHSDSAHTDAHSDVAHTDVAHSDVAHVDGAHQDNHGDTAHSDTPHDDQHGDENIDFQDGFIHQDQHIDIHFDTAHVDVSHSDSHADAAHGDVTHQDVAHSDVSHSDTHDDVAHADGGHADTAHSDTHSDTPHSDTAHTDSAHTDTAHSDTPHTDVGLHCDVNHVDI